MPFARISVGQHRSAAAIKAISDGVYEALVEAVHAPEDDKFQVITRHTADELIFSPTYLGIERSADLTFIQIFLYPGRTVAQKKLLHHTIAQKLADNPGMRQEDVFIILVDVPRENWSYGNGEAQFAPKEEPAAS
ncbi:tautomerase family protein [Hymenobacter sp. HMF4947]|uniref:Tautomerase family protein n=1 Tax=Hymenobacter ginkgonis TaxID=2682976 RepID=A0A7K1TBC0_9BACT|nr:tautomerase family protein [Hymenobacter ginkgonis]MVN75679.1 tautomerase family protein [Hymenobacter ginkgonis]